MITQRICSTRVIHGQPQEVVVRLRHGQRLRMDYKACGAESITDSPGGWRGIPSGHTRPKRRATGRPPIQFAIFRRAARGGLGASAALGHGNKTCAPVDYDHRAWT